MRYILLSLLLCVGCGTAPIEDRDSSIFSDGDIQDFSVHDQDFLDGGVEDASVAIDMGRGTAGLGEACTVDTDCTSAHHVCDDAAFPRRCWFRPIGYPCDRYVSGATTERLCGMGSVGVGTVSPLESNNILRGFVWCLDISDQQCGNESCGFRCLTTPEIGGDPDNGIPGTPSPPSCLTDSDCAGHFVNPDCYFNTCRTLNCPTPLQTTGCQAGEICSGLNLCVPLN